MKLMMTSLNRLRRRQLYKCLKKIPVIFFADDGDLLYIRGKYKICLTLKNVE